MPSEYRRLVRGRAGNLRPEHVNSTDRQVTGGAPSTSSSFVNAFDDTFIRERRNENVKTQARRS